MQLAFEQPSVLMEEPSLRNYPRRSRHATHARPYISIVIPAHNEEGYIGATLAALNSQTFTDFEVLVVANHCTDRTTSIARELGARVIDLPERGLSRARNLGAAAALGQLLIFLDADTHLEADALAKVVHSFKADCAAGTLKGIPDEPKLWYRTMYWWKNAMHRWRIHEGSSGIILCWKPHFEAVGGFDEALNVRENSVLIQQLRQFGSYRYIGSARVQTSMRRYSQRGMLRTCAWWFKVWLQSIFGDIRHKGYEAVR